ALRPRHRLRPAPPPDAARGPADVRADAPRAGDRARRDPDDDRRQSDPAPEAAVALTALRAACPTARRASSYPPCGRPRPRVDGLRQCLDVVRRCAELDAVPFLLSFFLGPADVAR